MTLPALTFAAALLLGGCTKQIFPTASIDIGGHAIKVEIAADPELRARGLMHRDGLAEDRGMLFVYPDERTRSFWMKNVKFPLDIAFADASGTIVRITDMEPFSTEATPSLYPAQYAVEMNVGWFERNGVTTGVVLGNLPEVEAK